MPITAETLDQLTRAADTARDDYEAALAARDKAIYQALVEGKTHAWVAEAMGKSRGLVGQIAMRFDT